jgi:hypothetical protein
MRAWAVRESALHLFCSAVRGRGGVAEGYHLSRAARRPVTMIFYIAH